MPSGLFIETINGALYSPVEGVMVGVAVFICISEKYALNVWSLSIVTRIEDVVLWNVPSRAQSKSTEISFDWLHIPFSSPGIPTEYSNSNAIWDKSLQIINQIIFPENQLVKPTFIDNEIFFELIYNLQGKNEEQLHFFLGSTKYEYHSKEFPSYELEYLILENLKTYLQRFGSYPLESFDYLAEIQNWNISYVVLNDEELIREYSYSPFFNMRAHSLEIKSQQYLK
jgi:hypothetical protein